MKTLGFEFLKAIKKRTNIVALLLTLLAVVSLYFFNYTVAENIHEANTTRLQNDVLRIEGYVQAFLEEKEAAEEANNVEEAEELAMMVEENENLKIATQERARAFEEEDWRTILEGDISDLQFQFDSSYGTDTPGHDIEGQDTNWFTFRATLEEKQFQLENNLNPMIQNETDIAFLPTVYDNFTGRALEAWDNMTKRYGTTGYLFLYQVIQYLYIPIIILIGCFIFGNSISTEASMKRRGLHFYATLPVRRGTVYLTKFTSGFLYTVVFTFLMLGLPLLCSLFTGGTGGLDYPVLVYDGPTLNPFGEEYTQLKVMEDTFHFITLKEYFGYIVLFTILFALFIYSIYFVLSLFVKNPGITLFLTASILFIGMHFFQSPYSPFSYIDIHQIINRAKLTETINLDYSYKIGIILFPTIGIILAVLGYIKFRFRKLI
ncbi:ABC transporter permease [Oceanobacillus manasiensis]|uniref:ABC transporter permease n=1 Tax=Oceanobacillus manasiensis TaxID=586413 RepID=UPI00069403C5|nr:ABC transporter permease [Oceanobacillus manasiensis]